MEGKERDAVREDGILTSSVEEEEVHDDKQLDNKLEVYKVLL
jgi:hypothetical protein